MKHLHIIIGDSDTRKSSLIRCLSGAGQGNSKKSLHIGLSSGVDETVYVIQSALQENYKPQTPAQFINFANTLSFEHFLFSLRVKSTGHYPDCMNYLSAFSGAGFDIHNIALLGTSAASLIIKASNSVVPISNSTSQPTNRTAAIVRGAWGWV